MTRLRVSDKAVHRVVFDPYQALRAFMTGKVCDDTAQYVIARGARRLDLTVVDEHDQDWNGKLPATVRCRAIAVFAGHEVCGDSDPFNGGEKVYADNPEWWTTACDRLRSQFEVRPVEEDRSQ